MKRLDITDLDIIKAANTSNSAAEAARLLDINYKTYRDRAIKLGVFKTNQSLKGVSKPHSRLYSVDDCAFDKIDCETAYFLGFIAADGSIVDNTLRIMIQHRDVDILEKLLLFLKSNYPIGYCKSHYTDDNGIVHYFDAAYVKITSNHIVSSLANYGIVQGKKYINIDFLAKIPDKYKIDFVIGLVDGDGGIYHSGSTSISIALNKETCKSMLNVLKQLGIEYNVEYREKIDVVYINRKSSILKFSRLYIDSISRHSVLNRKRDIFISIIEHWR